MDKLTDSGYEAYAVGGCVRDIKLGREIHDWDITTSAKPHEIESVFGKIIGLKEYDIKIDITAKEENNILKFIKE